MYADHEEQMLELLGVNSNNRCSQVLRALIRAYIKDGPMVRFKQIQNELQYESKSVLAVPLIYRCLKNLEETGFIRRSSTRPVHYLINLQTIIGGIETLRAGKLGELQKMARQIEKKMEYVKAINAMIIADEIMTSALGKDWERTPMMLTGFSTITEWIYETIHKRVEPGDIVRICVDWVRVPLENEVQLYQNVEVAYRRGADVRVISREYGTLDAAYKKTRKEHYRRVKETCSLRYRIVRKRHRGYQFVARNQEACVLILSDNPYTAVALADATDNQIVKDAIEAFDRDWEQAIDMLEWEDGDE